VGQFVKGAIVADLQRSASIRWAATMAASCEPGDGQAAAALDAGQTRN